MVDLYHFVGLNFTDVCTHAHCIQYNQAYFAVLIRQSSVKTAKIRPLENFPLYGEHYKGYVVCTSNVILRVLYYYNVMCDVY